MCSACLSSVFGRFSDPEKRCSLTSSPVQGLSSLLLRFADRRPGNVLALPLSAPSRIFGVIFRSLDDQLAFFPRGEAGVERAPPAGFRSPSAGRRASVVNFCGLVSWEFLFDPVVRVRSNFYLPIPRAL